MRLESGSQSRNTGGILAGTHPFSHKWLIVDQLQIEGCKLGRNSIILFEKSAILTRMEETMDLMGFPKF
jgi:hypothetical protein